MYLKTWSLYLHLFRISTNALKGKWERNNVKQCYITVDFDCFKLYDGIQNLSFLNLYLENCYFNLPPPEYLKETSTKCAETHR